MKTAREGQILFVLKEHRHCFLADKIQAILASWIYWFDLSCVSSLTTHQTVTPKMIPQFDTKKSIHLQSNPDS